MRCVCCRVVSQIRASSLPWEIEDVKINGARLAVRHRAGSGPGSSAGRGVLLLHGWPGTGDDWSAVMTALRANPSWNQVTLICPDLRGYGNSDKPPVDLRAQAPYAGYAPAAQTADVLALIEHFALGDVLVGGYDIGANIAQALARAAGDRVAGLVLCDPVHAAARAQAGQVNLGSELWYQTVHLFPWAADLIGHDRETLEIYLRHFYTHWWGDGAVDEAHFQSLVDQYNQPGAFAASIAWYRSRAQSREQEVTAAVRATLLDTPTQVLWGERDPITPSVFAESLGQSFSDFELTRLPGVGHFAPLEAPAAVSDGFARLAGRLAW
jgi:pimeloyl-ACP methyl ester carboxylesterase